MPTSATTALIVVDVQGDFLPGGSLAVPDGDQVIDPIIEASKHAQVVVFTRDFHPPDHLSFADEPKFVDMSWPPHCVQGTEGVAIHGKLERAFPDALVFSKGITNEKDQYSGFEGVNFNDTYLDDFLQQQGVTHNLVVGLALDYCVRATALDSISLGYDTTVVADATRPVTSVTGTMATAEMADQGVVFVTTDLL